MAANNDYIGLYETSCKEGLVNKISTQQYTEIGSGKIK